MTHPDDVIPLRVPLADMLDRLAKDGAEFSRDGHRWYSADAMRQALPAAWLDHHSWLLPDRSQVSFAGKGKIESWQVRYGR